MTTKTYPVGTLCRYDNERDPEAIEHLPNPARRLLEAARESGWLWTVQWMADSADSPFVGVIVGRSSGGEARPFQIRATWHTRGTGTLRLFSLTSQSPWSGPRDMSLKAAIWVIYDNPTYNPEA
jgi:hypothetical protein